MGVLLLQFAKISCVHQNRARFGNVLLYGVGSVSRFFVLGEDLCTRTDILKQPIQSEFVHRYTLTVNAFWQGSTRDYEFGNVRK